MLEDIISSFSKWTLENYVSIGGKLIRIVLIWVVALMLVRLGVPLIKGLFGRRAERSNVNRTKNDTLKALIQSILRYVVYFIALIMILGELGINTTSILATAGIGGLAIGFGAQSLVKDIITGFFIIFEDQYGVGDFVKVEGITGTVVEIGLRITKIRGFEGDVNVIPNGRISKVTNYSKGNSAAIVDVRIAYEVDVDKAIGIINKTAEVYAKDNPDVAETPVVLGIVEMDKTALTLRVVGRTLPVKHWAVERDLRKEIKKALEANHIEVPYPKLKIMDMGEEKG
ncbi:MAG: mechanosensitive ion channel family protein [Clostridiales bacterium]|mgnify:CR=1 FL=1|nr:mechanosensitive ion channel family protein [Clostridiales bacterium]